MKTFPKPLKERVYESIKYFQDQYPDLDICIIGSMSMYLQDIKYKYPHDIDIVILNNTMSNDEFKEFSNKVYLMCWRLTGLRIDLLHNPENIEYNVIDLYDLQVKCNTLRHYIEYKTKFSESVGQKHKDGLEELNQILDEKENT